MILRTIVAASALCLAASSAFADAKTVARGRYLVEQVGMCSDCHSARDQKGQIVKETALHGAPLAFKPLVEMPWADVAPPIAGMPPGWTKAQLVTFLQTGKRPNGQMPRPPMPEFRFDKADATAVTDYLASLK